MTGFPSALRIRVVPTLDSAARVRQLLVGLDLRFHGRSYYRTLLGLTDDQGIIELTGQALRDDYRQAQLDFPMDYKLAIADCDPEAIVDLRGGPEFESRRLRALEAPIVSLPLSDTA